MFISPEDIQELLSNDIAFELYFNSLERVTSMKTVQSELRSGNENLARKEKVHETIRQWLSPVLFLSFFFYLDYRQELEP